jgi:hypothetical protein
VQHVVLLSILDLTRDQSETYKGEKFFHFAGHILHFDGVVLAKHKCNDD